jgi:hypothetical protein
MIPLPPDTLRNLWCNLGVEAGSSAVFLSECLLHSVEALFAIEQAESADPLALFVLRGLAFAQPPDVEHLNEILHLGRQVTRQILGDLVKAGLLSESSSMYRLTDQGVQTLNTGTIAWSVLNRRILHFLHPGLRYVVVHDPKGNLLCDLSPKGVPPTWEFDVSVLRELISRPATWKLQHRFPQSIVAVITDPLPANSELRPARDSSAPDAQTTSALEHIVVDKAQFTSCAILAKADGSGAIQLSAHPISSRGSLVQDREKALFTLADQLDIQATFPDIFSEPADADLAKSWQLLASQYELSGTDANTIRFHSGRLTIGVTEEFLDQWKTFVTLVLQGQVCSQIGNGRLDRVCPAAIEAQDEVAARALNVLRVVLTLEGHAKRVEITRSAEVLEDWLPSAGLNSSCKARALAEFAFQFERYRLAYQIGELEDMRDAAV